MTRAASTMVRAATACLVPALASTPTLAVAKAAPASVCISNIRIDRTEVVDERTILFVMRGHEVYRNTLIGRCFGLGTDPRGFTYAPTDNNDLLCSNLVTIRLNTYGTVCELGTFVRVK